MDSFDLSALVRPTATDDPLRFTLDVPDGLQQGRGAWGGVATGAMVAAAQLVDPRPEMAVRTLSAQLVAPVLVGPDAPGRRGAAPRVGDQHPRRCGVATSRARCSPTGSSSWAQPRTGDAMPDGPPWLAVAPPRELAAGPEPVPEAPVGPPLAPDFTVHLEMRPISGIPYSGADTDETAGWVRPRGPVERVDASVVTALADAWWVSVMARLDRPRPAATVGFTLDFPSDPSCLAA